MSSYRAEALLRLVPLERPADPTGIAQEAGAAVRDALLGRARPKAGNRTEPMDRDHLLGRVRPVRDRSEAGRDDDRER